MSTGSSILTRTDAVLNAASGEVVFERTYRSDGLYPNYARGTDGNPPFANTPLPFGGSLRTPHAAEWWDNFFSFVIEGAYTYVMDTQGRALQYSATCANADANPCWPLPGPKSAGIQERLKMFHVSDGGTYFVFYDEAGRRYTYDIPFQYGPKLFLHTIDSPTGQRAVTIVYDTPAGCGTGAGTGAPFIKTITAGNGTALTFTYKWQTRPDAGGQPDCVIDSIAAGPGGTIPVVNYTYTNGNSGRLAVAGLPDAGVAETYGYSAESMTFDGPFGKGTHHYSVGVVSQAESTWGTWNMSGSFSPDDAGLSTPTATNLVPCDPYAWDAGASCAETLAYTVASIPDQLSRAATTINATCSPGGGALCAPGQISHARASLPSSNGPVSYVANNCRSDPQGGLFCSGKQEQITQLVSGIFPQRTETTRVYEGTPDAGLEWAGYTYDYNAAANSDYQQLVSTRTSPSAISPGWSPPDVVETYTYDTFNRTTKVSKAGLWYSPSWGWLPAGKTISTFYFYTPSNAADVSTVEVHGPCASSGSDCQGTGFQRTAYQYYTPNDPPPNQRKIKRVDRYIDATNYLSTSYTYDTFGNVATTTDPNGVITRYNWDARGNLTQAVDGRGMPTNYRYDNGTLASIIRPKGNVEYFCYRDGTGYTNGAGCIGAWTSKLQWKTKASASNGDSWSEKVKYSYWPSGVLQSETYINCTSPSCNGDVGAEVRRIKKYSVDAHENLVRDSSGETPGVPQPPVVAVQRFDYTGHLVATGRPYVTAGNPGMNCDVSGDPKCSLIAYDSASRPTSITEYSDPLDVGSAAVTCFAYDRRGNISQIATGCTADCAGACLNSAIQYIWDDFGNIAMVVMPDSGASASGVTKYEYDALGNVTSKSTEALRAAGTLLHYVYDRMGRLTRISDDLSGLMLAGFEYDRDSGYPMATECESFGGAHAFDDHIQNTAGRLRGMADSFGSTWYSYDPDGRVTREFRLRRGGACRRYPDDPTTNDDLRTRYFYDDNNGNLTSMTYPHGRKVEYQYWAGAGREDRVSRVMAYKMDGSTTFTDIVDVAWEPYGGVRYYAVRTSGSGSTVEYLLGAAAQTLSGCASDPGANDYTGRMRGVRVTLPSVGGATRSYGRNLTWKGDQVVMTSTCINGGWATTQRIRTERDGYDGRLRLLGVMRPDAIDRYYTYDKRGNRLSESEDDNLTLHYSTSSWKPDQLTSRSSAEAMGYDYEYDADGRVTKRTPHAFVTNWDFLSILAVHALPGTVRLDYTNGLSCGGVGCGAGLLSYRVAKVGMYDTAAYSYWYDGKGRRWSKQYPLAGVTDEFYYDYGHQLLEDRGINAIGSGPWTIDDYIWLDGKPIAIVKSTYSDLTQPERRSEAGNLCQRNGSPATCGIYFAVTDNIGRVIATFDSAGLLTGASQEEHTFGRSNYRLVHGETAHPETSSTDLGRLPYQSWYYVTDLGAWPTGTMREARVKFHLLDEGGYPFNTPNRAVLVEADNSSFTEIGAQNLSGSFVGPLWTPWADMRDSQKLDVRTIHEGSPARCGCVPWLLPGPPYGIPFYCPNIYCGTSTSWDGASLEAVEYRIRDSTARTSIWTPLLFQGQYYDDETQLVENWHRYYDPSIGRYLQPEPMLLDPKVVASYARAGVQMNPYAYAANNPMFYVDPTGEVTWGGDPKATAPFKQAAAELRKIIGDRWAACDSYFKALNGKGIEDWLKDNVGPTVDFVSATGSERWKENLSGEFVSSNRCKLNKKLAKTPSPNMCIGANLIHELGHVAKAAGGGEVTGDFNSKRGEGYGAELACFGSIVSDDKACALSNVKDGTTK